MFARVTVGVLAVVALSPAGVARADAELAPVMVVLDASGSMKEAAPGGTKMSAARKAVRTLVDAMPAEAEVGLTVYGANTGSSAAEKPAGCKDVRVVQPVGALDKAAITKAADTAQPRGYTPIGQALRTAAAALPKEGPRSVVLVSDGEDTCAPPDPCEVAGELAKQGVDLRIHTVGYQVDGKARRQLACIAQATGGTYTDVPDASALGRALTRVTASAVRNYQAAGTPVSGTFALNGAPVLTPGGYLDTLGFTRKRYYSVDIPDGYTAYFAATVPLGRRGSTLGSDGLNVKVYGVGGVDCNEFENQLGGQGEAVSTLVTWTVRSDRPGEAGCRQPGRYRFAVYFSQADDSAPIEEDEKDRLPLEMQIGLEPPATDPGPEAASSPVEYSEPSGATQPVAGGGSFGTAATLPGSGQYEESMQLGEEVYYRIRVNWGQGLAFRVEYGQGDLHGEAANIKSTLYSPARGRVAADTTAYLGTPEVLPTNAEALATRPIRYRNRSGSRGVHTFEDQTAASVAGWYYIAVKLGPPIGSDRDHAPVPVTLKVSLAGTPEAGPRYADAAAGKEAFDGTQAAASPSLSSASHPTANRTSGDSIPLWWIGAGLGFGTLLAAAVVGAVLAANHRRRRIGGNFS